MTLMLQIACDERQNTATRLVLPYNNVTKNSRLGDIVIPKEKKQALSVGHAISFQQRKNMRKPSRNSIDYYIQPNKIMCNIAGIWPFDEEQSRWKIILARCRLVFSVLGICTIFVPQVMIVVMNWGDLEILTSVGCVITTTAQLLFKMFYLLARRERAYRLYKELRSFWSLSDDPEERESFETFAYWARIGSISFYLSVGTTAVIYTSTAFLDYVKDQKMSNGTGGIRHLPFDAWYGINVTGSPDFEIAFICQVVAAFMCTTTVCGIVTTCAMIILHISGQFRLISTWINGIGIEINGEQMDYLHHCSPKLIMGLIKCIHHHQRLINVINEVNALLTPIIFLQLLTSGVEICLSGFALLNNCARSDLLKFIGYLISMLMQLLLWCGPGEFLIQESQELGYSAYLNLPWYKLPPTYRRLVLLMILRSQKYSSISTLTFDRLSIHTLTSVFNTAASYFALLRQVQEKSLSQ